MTDLLRKRYYVCKEIIETEEKYVRDLEVIVNVFMEPMKKKRIINEELVLGIFGNIPVLLNINKKLLESLHAAVKYDTENPDYVNANLGAVLLKFCPFFKMYSNYCKVQSKATAAIRELKKSSKFNNFYKTCCSNPGCRGMELPSFLIMPVQRIPRYQLLLKELQKRTPEDHSDYPFIQKALESIVEVAVQCDQAMKGDMETSLKLSIQHALGNDFILCKPSRKLLKYNPCTYVHMKEKKSAMCFLFSDLLIITNAFDSELTAEIYSKNELYMFNYFYNEKALPTTVEAQNVFERFFLEFDSQQLAQEWHQALTSSLAAVLDRSIGSKCEICFGPLKPAYCCHCLKCDKICCHSCCAYINSHDRKTSSKNMACLSCIEYNNSILMNNTNVQELKHSQNSVDKEQFIQPTFVLNMNRKVKLNLPEGWEACMLNDSRVYYFNREKWISSWSLPKKEFDNDSPYGWQKYYDERGNGFYYNVKTKDVRYSLPTDHIQPVGDCPACGYTVTNQHLEKGYCPGCNTCLHRAFSFVCLQMERRGVFQLLVRARTQEYQKCNDECISMNETPGSFTGSFSRAIFHGEKII